MNEIADLPTHNEDGNARDPQKQSPFQRSTDAFNSLISGKLSGVSGFIAEKGKSAACFWLRPSSLVRKTGIIALVLMIIAVSLRSLAEPENSSERLAAIELAIKNLQTGRTTPGVSRTDVANATTLLVAVQFVTAAAERSTPFDTALAVAISMMGEHPRVGPLLDELLIEATAGVPSREQLGNEFRAQMIKFEEDGIVGGLANPESRSSFRLGGLFGLGDPEISAEHQAIIKALSADVADNNLDRAVQLVSKLDGLLREGLESWREKAERRVAVDNVLTELRRAAFIDIIEEAS
jgi:hypothetical protein